MATNQVALFSRVNDLLKEIGGSTLTQKVADTAMSEPEGNGAGSDSSSPTTKVDDGLVAATPGARAREMSSEVQANNAVSVDGSPDANANASEEDRQADVGITVSGIGNDPAQEDNYTGTIDEPGVGTESVAKFDDGRKYASAADFAKRPVAERTEYLTKFANNLLADIVADTVTPQTKTKKTANDKPANPPITPETKNLIKEAEAGYQVAAVLGMEKLSADQRAQVMFEQVLGDATLDADLFGAWLMKQADDANEAMNADPTDQGTSITSDPDDHTGADNGGGDSSTGGSVTSGGQDMAAAPSPDSGIPSEQAINDALNSIGGDQGGDASGGDAPPNQDELLQNLIMIMHELGITPDDLAQMTDGQGQKLASAAKAYQRSGKFNFKIATTGREKAIQKHIKGTLLELLN